MVDQNRPKPDDYFSDWKKREALAESIIPMVGKLSRENNVACYIYGRSLVNQSPIEIMKHHRFVRQIENNELSEFESTPVLEVLSHLELGPAHIDVGRIAVGYMNNNNDLSIEDYVKSQVKGLVGSEKKPLKKPQDVVLFGFGRIGRLMARLLVEKTGGGDVLRLRAIVVRKSSNKNDLVKRASLLRRDSVHGSFKGTIRVDEENNTIICNGNEIKVIYANSPEEIDYTEYDIHNAIVVDNTGVRRTAETLAEHLESKGSAKVLLTAPGKGMPNIVHGINDDQISMSDTLVSAASCTTNAIVPVLKVMIDEYGIKSGHVETVHAYTNDQNLIDNYHKGDRRGRSAALNMVLTETGAASAAVKVLPELEGKLTGNAIRVPIPNVSMAILNLEVEKATDVDSLNEFMRKVALHSPLRKQIDYTDSPEVVNSDFIGSRTACIFDAKATIVNGNHCVLYCWYDNEFGYACQVHRILEQMSGVNYQSYPIVE